jgi:hypothetical protein
MSKYIYVDGFIKEVKELEEASKLLEEIYLSMGHYKSNKIPDEIWSKVQNHFKFDDSE